MSKIAESVTLEDKKLIVKQVHDFNPVLKRAEQLRQAGQSDFGESKLVGVVPNKLIAEWAKEAGIKFDDPALKDIIKRKMLSGDFDRLRVYRGTY